MQIIIFNPKKEFTNEQWETLSALGEVTLIEKKDGYQDNPVFKLADDKVIVLGPEVVDWTFPNEFIDTIPQLKAICLPTTAFAWVDGQHLREKNIILTNVPKYSTESVAEYAISLMLNITKKLPLVMKHNWQIDYDQHLGQEVKGKTMGIIGLGTIGTRIAELGQAMGMNVVYWSRSHRDQRFTYQELDEVLATADFIYPTLARNANTHQLLDKNKIALMSPSAYIVSITGDDIFDSVYAAEQVVAGRLAGIAFESDKKTMSDYQGNVWVTPPIAWYTKEALAEDMRIWVATAVAIVHGQPINVVN